MITAPTLLRLKSARGHLDAVIRMVEEERYCVDVLHQIGAVQAALDHVRRAVLEDHLRTCVRDAYAEGRFEDMVDELVAAMTGDMERSTACARQRSESAGATQR